MAETPATTDTIPGAAAAEAQSAAPSQRPTQRQPLSRPVFRQTLNINSLQAQRVMDRSFDRVSNALFSLGVILPIIGDQKETEQVEEICQGHIERLATDIAQAMNQLQKVMTDNGIEEMPGYSMPVSYAIEITSPQVAQFAHQVRNLDKLMGMVDTLWLNSLLSNQQRSDATYEWQQRLIRMAGRIIGVEKRARIAAHSKGKGDEVAEAAPEQEILDTELSNEANVDVDAAVAETA